MANGYATFVQQRRFGALDGLRAISVIAVVWHHTSGTPGPTISRNGYLGVELFFAISGFLITTLLLRERNATGAISLRRFYARRALRIFPLYYAVLALYAALTVATRLHTPEGQQFLSNLPAFATYTANWFVNLQAGTSVTFYFAWSLATEEQFYLLWPPVFVLLCWILGKRGPIAASVLLIALVVADQMVTLIGDPTVLPVRIVSSLSLPILLGALSAIVLADSRGYAILWPLLGNRLAAPVATACLILVVCFDLPIEIAQVVIVLTVLTVVIREDTVLHPFLQLKPLAFTGAISYGVYLMHMLASNAVRPILRDTASVAIFALTVVVVIIAAFVSFQFFEAPLLRIKRRFEVVTHANDVDRE